MVTKKRKPVKSRSQNRFISLVEIIIDVGEARLSQDGPVLKVEPFGEPDIIHCDDDKDIFYELHKSIEDYLDINYVSGIIGVSINRHPMSGDSDTFPIQFYDILGYEED